ncbi:MAG: hypothetical protein M0P58_13575 [Bacteroidales bacterium]|nr:hypothetical protein [Bacteroidales bacterium]
MMKRITLLLFFILQFFWGYAQKCKIDSVVDSSDGTTAYYTENWGNYQSGQNNMLIHILKIKNNYYLKGSYTRFMSRDFQINLNNPFVICFEKGEDIILYPQDMSISEADRFDFISTMESWNRSCDVLYKIEKEQLIFLMKNIPSQIKVYVTSEKIKTKNTDSLGKYECLNYRIKYWHKMVVKAIECILTVK